jgi:ABC-2 type transport system permease protein
MSGNEAFEMVTERGWSRGLSTMLRSGLARWFRTRSWWVNSLIWSGIIGFILAGVAFNPQAPPFEELLSLFCVFIGLFPAVGVIITMQDALVSEKSEGTAAWVLSKPVTRHAFVLSKVISNAVGILFTMVFVPGCVAYAILSIAHHAMLDPLAFLAALVIIFISDFFFLSLTLMLGTLFNIRAPVIGIPLAVLFFQQNIIQFLPSLRFILPWNLVIPIGNANSLVLSLLLNTQPASEHLVSLIAIAIECLLFILISLWRFSREEF